MILSQIMLAIKAGCNRAYPEPKFYGGFDYKFEQAKQSILLTILINKKHYLANLIKE